MHKILNETSIDCRCLQEAAFNPAKDSGGKSLSCNSFLANVSLISYSLSFEQGGCVSAHVLDVGTFKTAPTMLMQEVVLLE